jgi:hypothetical protein
MKAYSISPGFDFTDGTDPRLPVYVLIVSALIVDRLRNGGDSFHYVVDWRDPGSPPWQGWTDNIAEPHLIALGDAEKLTEVVRASIDPFVPGSATVIRSVATCRAVTFGYDGNAFLCLRHNDAPPIALDTNLVTIEEQPSLIAETDYFDGYVPQSD